MGIGTLRVYDIGGRLVYEARVDGGPQTTIPIAPWPAGMYTIQAETPLGIAVKKFEKAR